MLGGGAGGEGSPGIILGLPVLLRHTGILCHKDAGAEGIPGIIPGMPVLLRCSGILILGMPVLLRCSGILPGWTSVNLSRDYPRTALVTVPCVRYLVLYMAPLDMCVLVRLDLATNNITCFMSSPQL